jgi:cyanate permease
MAAGLGSRLGAYVQRDLERNAAGMGQRRWVMVCGVVAWLGSAVVAAARLLESPGGWRTTLNIALLVGDLLLLIYWLLVWRIASTQRQRTTH